MHNNFYFLRQLTSSLSSHLKNAVISACFSQHKDELIIRFESSTNSFFIKANLQSSFSCLTFPKEFNRARKNSIDLFEEIIGLKVVDLKQFNNERSFSINLIENYCLLFKLHGNKANIILFKDSNMHAMFRKNLKNDLNISIDNLDRVIDWSYENFVEHIDDPGKEYFTFGKMVWRFLEARGFSSLSTEEKWKMIQEVRLTLEEKYFFIIDVDDTIALSLLPYGKVIKEFISPIEAINSFYTHYIQHYTFRHEKSRMLSDLEARLSGRKQYLSNALAKLDALKKDDHFKTWADLVMANLHIIKPGSASISLPDFYHEGKMVDIKLKKDLSAQKNAALFYRKAKNRSIEMDHLQRMVETKEQEIKQLEQQKQAIEEAHELTSLRENNGLSLQQVKNEKQPTAGPYYEVEFKGFRIWIGKNAASNDELTLKHSYKEDLWLHAKDVSGSHVLIKYQSGKKFPNDVIERAAQFAAYNSKRKNESLCPVVVVPKKFVRKRKGDPPGSVVVEREEVIMVEPRGIDH